MNARLLFVMLLAGCSGLALAAGSGIAAARGADSAATLYNEGNAAARAGKPALAVLSYERARLLAPRDADIQANLQTVRQRARVPVPTAGWFAEYARIASPDTLYWCGLTGLLLIGGGLISRRLRPTHRRAAAIVAATGVVMVTLTACDVLATVPLLQESVVMNSAAVRASPVSSGDPLFVLAPAELVHVQGQHLNYSLVRDGGGRMGWVATGDLTPVVPPEPASPVTRS